MSLLVCPNCKVPMVVVPRNGVEIDVCPDCQGVWLDRGEIDRLMAFVSAAPSYTDAHRSTVNMPRPASGFEMVGTQRTNEDHYRDHDSDDHSRKHGNERGHSDEHGKKGGFWNNIFD